MPIFLPELGPSLSFPALSEALTEPDGLLAMGGDLSPARLLAAYQQGIFPWFCQGDPILWWSPSVRALFEPGQLQFNRTLRKQHRRMAYQFSVNKAFRQVVASCAAPRTKQSDTWIVPQMQQAYYQLHLQGHAHSIEVWQHEQLVGGLYGLTIGQLFCGESMFNRQPGTARLALIALQQQLQRFEGGWIDCQLPNDYLQQLGVQSMMRADFVSLLQKLAAKPMDRACWHAQSLLVSDD
ncbi:leucyl/phenylalanyl-tRNA--protein transferase [Alkalimonas amylolytica]|uniref:Leucyl/phenylalanyl-tRNA--protein transferase n=1 Tax=Alkalimonas amylolytica TaxID=152573 RepID=A0A1H4B1I6_ALKAM|nr:leucyl/phenylalanyl-tRNA--protein transferase [Alkalimonas amylolytica]SEA42000.1 leucyl/phenylalanyl-tRNA--protein transferase [Alkalimonas amylolytica]